jgi:hypothetical protein
MIRSRLSALEHGVVFSEQQAAAWWFVDAAGSRLAITKALFISGKDKEGDNFK